MALPKAVQKQVDESNRLYGEMYNPQEKETPAEVTPANEQPVVEDKVEVVEPVEGTPPEEVVATGVEVTEEAVAVTDNWEHKYKTLQGIHRADTAKFKEKIKRLEDENKAVRAILESLESASIAEPAPTDDKQTNKVTLIKPEEVEEYGSELVDLVRRAAREEFLPELTKLRSENERLRNSLGTVSKSMGETARKSVFTSLSESVPNWQDVNRDPAFLEWLDEADTFSGEVRRDLLQRAFEKNDAGRVVAFFKSYLGEAAVVGSTQVEEPPPRTAKVDTAALIAPGKPKASNTASTPKEGRIWTQAKIAEFYKQVREGKYRGRDAEKAATERDIVDAATSGRIRT